MNPARWSAALIVAMLLVGCVPVDGSPPYPPPSSATADTPMVSSSPTPSRSATRSTTSPEPTPSLPVKFPISGSLLDGGAAVVVQQLHEISGLRPALKMDVSKDEVTLTVLTRNLQARSYLWRDGIIELSETDVEYLHQTTFWPTDFALDNVRRIFEVSALLGTSSNEQLLQVVEYRPGRVFMSVTTSPEASTIFFRKDGTVFRNLGTTSVIDIREGLKDVVDGARKVYSIGFDAQSGYHAELPTDEGPIERRSRIANQPVFTSKHTGNASLVPFDPRLLDPAAIAQSIAAHDRVNGCKVEIDNRFERVQPIITYQCDGKTYHSDLDGRDLTAQLS